MRPWLLLVAGALACGPASVLLGACASDENSSPAEPDAAELPPPASDAASDAAEAGSCADCEFFPETCTPDAFCSNGPFDPANPAAGMDWRTRINAIRGRSTADVWIVGAVGAAAHFDRASWTRSDMGTQESQSALWLLPTGEISLGSVKKLYTRGIDIPDAGASPGGWSGTETPRKPFDFGRELTSAWAIPNGDTLWLATETALWRLRLTPPATFEIVPGVPASTCSSIPCRRMRSIHGSSGKTLWAVGDIGSAVQISDADGDAPIATPFNTLTWTGLTGVWAASDTDVWAVGGIGTVRHYTGDARRWEIVAEVPTDENLNAVWGTSSSDIWAVGNAGVVLHWDGAKWARVKIAGLGSRRPDLHSVWSPAPGHVWIGGYGVVLALGGRP